MAVDQSVTSGCTISATLQGHGPGAKTVSGRRHGNSHTNTFGRAQLSAAIHAVERYSYVRLLGLSSEPSFSSAMLYRISGEGNRQLALWGRGADDCVRKRRF